MAQKSLFDPGRNYRDDEESREAAKIHEPKRNSQAARVLSLLRTGPQSGSGLARFVSWRAAARVHDLREKGYDIETRVGKDGIAWYVLHE